jgi:hypothetical protein
MAESIFPSAARVMAIFNYYPGISIIIGYIKLVVSGGQVKTRVVAFLKGTTKIILIRLISLLNNNRLRHFFVRKL